MIRNMQQLRVCRVSMVAGVFVAASLAGACGGGTGRQPAAPAPDVWAVVDGRQILRADVDKAYRIVTSASELPSNEEVLAVKLGILDELITQDILLAKARELGVEATDVEIDNAFAEQKRSMSDEDFNKQLATRGLTADDIKQGLRRELSVQKLIEREVTAKIAITDDDIAAFYNQNRQQFNLAEPHYRLAQIVVTPQRDPQLRNRLNDDAATLEEARRKADMLTARIRSGANFADVAMDYSEDPQTAAQGGDLGLIPESALNRLPPPLRNAVLKTEPGRASTMTIGENHVVLMVISREPAGQRELGSAQVRDGIRDLLRNRKEQLLNQAYLTRMRTDADIVNYLARQVVDMQGRVPELTADVPAPLPVPPAEPAPATR